MSLQMIDGSNQKIIHRRDAGVDDFADWSVLMWVYLDDDHPADRRDMFKKAHAKRLGIEGVAQTATTGYVTLKQNFSGGLIQYGGQTFTAANQWWCIAGVVDGTSAGRGYIYIGDLSTTLAEIPVYAESIGIAPPLAVETDEIDPVWDLAGDIIIGNEPGRSPYESKRGFPGRIGLCAFWSDALTLAELRQQQWSLRPSARQDVLELFTNYGWSTNGKQADLSGNGRNGYTVVS